MLSRQCHGCNTRWFSHYEIRCCFLFCSSLSLPPSLSPSLPLPPSLPPPSLPLFLSPSPPPFSIPPFSPNRSIYMTFVDRFLATVRSRGIRRTDRLPSFSVRDSDRNAHGPRHFAKTLESCHFCILCRFTVFLNKSDKCVATCDILSKKHLRFHLLLISFFCNNLVGLFMIFNLETINLRK